MCRTSRIHQAAFSFVSIILASGLGLMAQVSSVLAAPGLSEAWVRAYDAANGSGDVDEGKAMAVDGSGNVYVTGGATNYPNANAPLSWSTTGTGTASNVDTYIKQTGAQSLRLDFNGASTFYGRQQTVGNLVPGTSATLSGWLKNSMSDTQKRLQCDIYGTGIDSAGIQLFANGDWTYDTETVTIPAGTTSVNVRCFADGTPDGTAWVDNISLLATYTYVSCYYGYEEGYGYHDICDTLTATGEFLANGTFESSGTSGSDAGLDYVTVKYNSSGTQQWQAARYGYATGGSDQATAIAVDGSGNIYVTGKSNAVAETSASPNYDYATVKYNSAGVKLWAARYHSGDDDAAAAIAVDASGNVYVTGRSGTPGAYNITTIKYDSNGTQVAGWGTGGVVTYNSGSRDEGVALVLDGGGNPVVTGRIRNGSLDAFYTVKYSAADGSIISGWGDADNAYNGGSNAYPSAMKIDGAGNVYVAGRKFSQNSNDFLVVKYDSAGARQWGATYSRGDDVATSLAVDGSGDVYVAGYSTPTGTLSSDYVVAKFSGSNGARLWTQIYDNGDDGSSYLPVVALDGLGQVVLSGSSLRSVAEGGTGTYDYVTALYDAGTGEPLYMITYNGGNLDAARAMVADGAGNVYVTGGNYNDYSTVKYAPAVVSGQADLVVTTLSPSATNVGAGDGITVTNAVKNQATGIPAGASDVSLYLVAAGLGSNGVFFDAFDASLYPWTQLYDGAVSTVNSPVDGWVLSRSANADPNGGTAALPSTVSDFDLRLYTKRTDRAGGLANRYSVTDGGVNGYDVALNYGNGNLEVGRRDGAVLAPLGSVLVNGALEFDGNDAVSVADPTAAAALNPSGSYSIEFWVYPDSWGAFSLQKLNVYSITNSGAGGIFFRNGTSTRTASGGHINTGQWNHVVAVHSHGGGSAFSTSMLFLYVNSVLVDSRCCVHWNAPNTNPLVIGAGFDGRIEQVAIYNTGLSGATITDHYNNGYGKSLTGTANLAAYWNFDQTSGNAIDSVGGKNGTLSGATWVSGLHEGAWYTLQLLHQGNSLTGKVFNGKVDPATATPLATALATDSNYATFTQVNVMGGYTYYTDDVRVTGLSTVNLATQGILLGTRGVVSLFPGGQDSADTAVTIPLSVTPGRYNLAAMADSGDAVTESSETNNITFGAMLSLLPDLTVSSLGNLSGVMPNPTITDTVTNGRRQAAASFLVKYYLSTDATITTGDTEIGSRTLGGLAGNASDTATTSLTVPSLPDGVYYVGAMVDPAGSVAEHNEYNNTAQAAQNLIISAQPDLTVTSVANPGTSAAGDTITVDATIRNLSGTAAGAFTVKLYLSTDSTITAGDTQIGAAGGYAISALAGLTSIPFTPSVSVPAGMAGPTYFLGVIVDTALTVAEYNEGNNTGASGAFALSADQFPKDTYLNLVPGSRISTGSNPSALSLAAPPLTIEAWVKLGDYDGDRAITRKASVDGISSYNYALHINTLGQPYLIRDCVAYTDFLGWYVDSGSQDCYDEGMCPIYGPEPDRRVSTAPVSVPLNSWTHLAATNDAGGGVKIYKDGTEVYSGATGCTGDGVYTNTNVLHIAANWTAGSMAVDDVRVWSVARSQAQIQANKDIEILGSEAGLAGYWRIDENSGTVVYDATSNLNDGTLFNSPVWATSVLFGGSGSSSSSGGGAVAPVELLLLAMFSLGLLAVLRRQGAGGLKAVLVVSLVIAGTAAAPRPGEAAGGFTFNFQTPSGNDTRACGELSCDAMSGQGSWEMPTYYASTNVGGRLYWHYVNVDPAHGFAYEVYVGGGYAGDMGTTENDYSYDNSENSMGNAADPLSSNWVFTGNGTGDPRGTAMRILITEPSDDAESPYAYSFSSDFLKDDTTRKPRIEQQINPSSNENSDVIMRFVADMRGVAYGDKSTDISNDPLHYTNTLIMTDPALEGSGDFNVGTGAQNPFVTAGRYTLDNLYNNPDGYSYWHGDFNSEPSWGAIFKHPGYLP